MKKSYLKNVVNEAYAFKASGKSFEKWKTNSAFRAIYIDLYSGKPKELPAVLEDVEPWIEGLKPSMSANGAIVTYKGEEYMIVITGNR